ncbi:MAG: toxin [Proteobacteria bacterium]|nr:toxin [Pseudomonadota bacterium]
MPDNEEKKIKHHKIDLPKGGGAIRGIGEKFQANAITGTGSFSLPIPTTPCRGGFDPKLSLAYDSGSGNSPFGLGWTVDIPAVSRKTAKALPRYLDGDESDTFLLSGAEDLVPLLEDNDGSSVDGYTVFYYRPRIEGLYARIEKWVASDGTFHWQAVTRDNVTSIYGKSEQARIADPNAARKIFKWLLEESFDAKGNRIVYEYKNEDNVEVETSIYERNKPGAFSNKHLKRIYYGSKKGEPDNFHYTILFDYGEHGDLSLAPEYEEQIPWPSRTDPFSEYKSGFEIRTYRLCQRIAVFHDFAELGPDPVPVKGINLEHDQNEVATYLTSVTQQGFKPAEGDTFEIKALPSVSFEYSKPKIDQTLNKVDSESLENLPQGISGPYQWVDLEGEGLSGILVEQGDAWYYKQNEGNGSFSANVKQATMPQPTRAAALPQLTDIDGDGNQELVLHGRPLSGFFSYKDGTWESFRPFRDDPKIDFNDPFSKQIDLTGDGRPDLLISEDQVFTWYESQLADGYRLGGKVSIPFDEEQGPRVVFSEPMQTVFLADMGGDGLTDIVRIRNGEVCYWSNLGYGRFGAKVTMKGAPTFDRPDLFNANYIKLADIDGSGTSDIFYLGNGKAAFWLNQSGNSLSLEHELAAFPKVDSASNISLIDLVGRGTTCIVWSSTLPRNERLELSYIDLMADGKPHLLTKIDNNMGKVVNITYAPSTEDYLRDKNSEHPWITKLPFPVHVLREVETVDEIGGTFHDVEYKYHHGYFDGPEREFRGFGMVETLDSKEFEKYEGTDQGEHYVKPVLTKTWFHNGAFLKQGDISTAYREEYYTEVGDILPDTQPPVILDAGPALTTEERKQAYRAMKGRTLRQEVWEWDPDNRIVTGPNPAKPAPYTVAESNFTVNRLQPKGENKFAVFRVDPRETITWHFEQYLDDPRIAHDLTLQVDDYGNVKKSCAVVYPRQGSGHPTEQSTPYATCAVNEYTELIGNDVYLHSVPKEMKSFEVKLPDLSQGKYHDLEDVKNELDDTAGALFEPEPFEGTAIPGKARLLTHQRYNYWNDGTTEIGPQALLKNVESMTLTNGIVANAFDGGITTADLDSAGYIQDGTDWWNPGLIQHYADQSDFYLPVRTEDPFGKSITVTYDAYCIAPIKTEDALGNTSMAEIDYRTMSPKKLTGPNGNSTEAITDPLGMVIATSVYGTEAGADQGDDPLTSYTIETASSINDVLADPNKYLQNATTFFYYDLNTKPVRAIGLSRETHVKDLGTGEQSNLQISLTYSDGFGRELQTKLKAEEGKAWVKVGDGFEEQDVTERWLVSGRTVYNNKEKPIKQYEPFYSATPEYEDEEFFAEYGVTPVIHYDPLLRVIRTDTPKGFFSKVEFTPWEVLTYDVNDTVLVSDYYADYSNHSADEQAALDKAAAHADTPSIALLDTLGRQFMVKQTLMEGDPPTTKELTTFTEFDITGKPLSVTDPRQYAAGGTVKTFEYTYDMTGATLRTINIDAGDDRIFSNVMGNPIKSFDARGHAITAEYDELHRLKKKTVTGNSLNNTVEALEYGEGVPNATDLNLRGQLYKHYDQSGLTTYNLYNIKGQLRQSEKRIRTDYKDEVNWPDTNKDALLETETFTSETNYDALGRVKEQHNPDGSIVKPSYHQSGRLNTLDAKLKGETTDIQFVTSITYNAKSQREKIAYGNNTETEYEYEPETFRLTSLKTTRTSDSKLLQDISYVYEPVGNIVKITDDSHNRIFTSQGPVEPKQEYTYDALYRLINATGRTHEALTKDAYKTQADFKNNNAHLNDLTMMRQYTRGYTYDENGNLHTLSQTGHNPFTQHIKIATDSNKAVLNTLPGDTSIVATPVEIADYFDENGNQKKLEHLNDVTWNYRDNIDSATIIKRGGPDDDIEYYVYDAAGQRSRKVRHRLVSGNIHIEEKFYVGGIEVKRRRQDGGANYFERTDLHVMDDKQRIAIVNHWNIDNNNNEGDGTHVGTNKIRYQYSNHLGSASLELDGAGDLISYEEYFPYGGTSFITGQNATDVSLKEYRYTGKERDDSTGLYYYGARYYAPWLGRWLSADPAGPVDGLNLYQYVSGNPVKNVDDGGMAEKNAVARAFDWLGDKVTEAKQFWGEVAAESGEAIMDTADQAVEHFGLEGSATGDVVRGLAVGTATLTHTAIEGTANVLLAVPSIPQGLEDTGTDIGEGVAKVTLGEEGGARQIADSTGLITAGEDIGEGGAKVVLGEEGGTEQLVRGAISGAQHAMGGVATKRALTPGKKPPKPTEGAKPKPKKQAKPKQKDKAAKKDEPETTGKPALRKQEITGTKESISELKIKEGIYEFETPTGKKYVGQSGNLKTRLKTHLRNEKMAEGTKITVREVQDGKLAREIVEQRRIDALGGVEKLANKVNPIGPARRHLMD